MTIFQEYFSHKECHNAPVVVLGNCLAARLRSEYEEVRYYCTLLTDVLQSTVLHCSFKKTAKHEF